MRSPLPLLLTVLALAGSPAGARILLLEPVDQKTAVDTPGNGFELDGNFDSLFSLPYVRAHNYSEGSPGWGSGRPYESRAAVEFDLSEIRPDERVVSARLLLEAGIVTHDPPPSIEILGYLGDGRVQAEDVNAINLVTSSGPLLADGALEPLEVTTFMEGVLIIRPRYVGFVLRNTTPYSGVSFLWEDGRGPALWVDLEAVEPAGCR